MIVAGDSSFNSFTHRVSLVDGDVLTLKLSHQLNFWSNFNGSVRPIR